MSNDAITQILIAVLSVMMGILIILCFIYILLKVKVKESKNKKETQNIMSGNKIEDKTAKEKKTQASKEYTKQSIMDFMEFEKIEDNMIVQKKGKRFLMAVECQGVNYDLMSRVEKVGVEEGFQQFLNTLRHPIQIYIQTRTINLENSVNTYKKKVKEIEDQYNKMLYQYNSMRQSNAYTKQDMEKAYYEITKQRNLLEYAKDLVNNTEKMSLNRNVLSKKYFIIIPYYVEDTGNGQYDYEELKNMAFSELYTKAQSIIRTLSSCSVTGKILNSQELVELLYVAYNRDESEVFGIEKAIKAGYEELYSTAPDVFEKKIEALDESIREEAINLANETIEKVKSRPQQIAEEKEENFEDLVKQMAEMILGENRQYVGEDVAQAAIKELRKEIENESKGGSKNNEEVKKTSARGRKRKTTK